MVQFSCYTQFIKKTNNSWHLACFFMVFEIAFLCMCFNWKYSLDYDRNRGCGALPVSPDLKGVCVCFGGLAMLGEASVWEYVYVYMWIFIHGSHSVERGGTAVVALVCCSLSSSGGQSETLRFFSHHCWENNRTRQFIGKFMMSKKWKRLLHKTNLLFEKPTLLYGTKDVQG